MRYIGSKTSVLGFLTELLPPPGPRATLCDPFGGISTVGAACRRLGFTVFAGDVLRFAHYFQISRLEYQRPPRFRGLKTSGLVGLRDVVAALQHAPPARGWVWSQFAANRQFFTRGNAQRIDGARLLIRSWSADGLISPREHAYLMASLVDSADRVANTAGTYYAHLKTWHRKALRPFRYLPLALVSGPPGVSYVVDALTLAGAQPYDVVYLDPPHNRRNYASYYHLPEALVSRSRPHARGRSGCNDRRPISRFCSPRTAESALAELVSSAQSPCVIVHYSDDGLVSPGRMRKMLAGAGCLTVHRTDALGYATTSRSRSVRHTIYIVRK